MATIKYGLGNWKPLMQTPEQGEFGPDELLTDGGQRFSSPTGSPALFGVGLEQIRQRRAAEDRRETERQRAGIGLNVNVGGRLAGGPLPNMWDDAFYGLLQARENAINASGKSMRLTPNNISEGMLGPNMLAGMDLYSREAGPDRNTANPTFQQGIDVDRIDNDTLNKALRHSYFNKEFKSSSNKGYARDIIAGLRGAR